MNRQVDEADLECHAGRGHGEGADDGEHSRQDVGGSREAGHVVRGFERDRLVYRSRRR